jgi:hypothetical protein
MARVNVGICPKYLSDQHLIAESVEITMITGGLRRNNYQIKSPIPNKFRLGTGHINFFKNKILYLHDRLIEVNIELTRRNIRNSTQINLLEWGPTGLCKSWVPSIEDSMIIRSRVTDRLHHPKKANSTFHKYYRMPIENMTAFVERLYHSPLFYV